MYKSDILNTFNVRHACMEFDTSKKVAEDDFDLILEAARLSPSAFGFEPWKFLVVQQKALRELLKEGAWGGTLKIETASHLVVTLCRKDEMRAGSPYLRYMMRDIQGMSEVQAMLTESLFTEFQTRDLDLSDDRALFDWASKQCYIALGNMMTAAALMGIGSCAIEAFNHKTTDGILAAHFGVDTARMGVVHMVAFGYRRYQPQPKTRKPLSEIVEVF